MKALSAANHTVDFVGHTIFSAPACNKLLTIVK